MINIGCAHPSRTDAFGNNRTRSPTKNCRRRSVISCAWREIGLAGEFARQSFGLVEAPECFVVPPEAFENPTLGEKRVGIRGSTLELGKRRGGLTFTRQQRRSSDAQPEIFRSDLGCSVQLRPGSDKIAVDFLELTPPKQCLENVGCRFDGFPVERSRLDEFSLALEIPSQVGQ